MNMTLFKALFRQTLVNPRQAGHVVIRLNLPTQVLWMGLMLMAVLLSLIVSALFHLAPMPPDDLGQVIQMTPAYQAPLIFALLNWGQAVVSVFVLYWVGKIFGGRGELGDMLSVMIWLQLVSILLGGALVLLGLAIPVLGSLGLLLLVFWGLWATIGLVDAAHGFDNMFKALGVCVVAALAGSAGMAMFSAVLGGIVLGRG